MKTSHAGLLSLYKEILSPMWIKETAAELELRVPGGIYNWVVVLWLMISQRLQPQGTLANAVEGAIGGSCGSLLRQRHRRKLSSRTGGYCRARQRMPEEIVTAAVEELTRSLQAKLNPGGAKRAVYLLDGTSLQLPHEKNLLERFPPMRNKQGKSHWPVLRMVVAQEARSGLAIAPAWGPLFGEHAVSEQALAEQVLEGLPAGAVVIGDRNFGVFSTAHAIDRGGRKALIRMTRKRAEKIAGGPLRAGSEQRLIWRPSSVELRRHPQLTPETCVEGRLLAYQLAGQRELLYLFTTWNEGSSQEILEHYGWRWKVETDLRSLKQTVGLHRVQVKSEAMLKKELLAAVAAYNLVQTIISMAVQPLGWHPRELSFTHAWNLVQVFLPVLLEPPSRHRREELRVLIRAVQEGRLPKRSKSRSYPREVWSRGYRYPTRHGERNGK